jgi:hypothetical protein
MAKPLQGRQDADRNLTSLTKLKAWYDRRPTDERKRFEGAVVRQQEWWNEHDLEQARNAPVDCPVWLLVQAQPRDERGRSPECLSDVTRQ